MTIVSVYIRPSSPWNPSILRTILSRCKPATLILGDFNAHNEAWGDKQTSARGRYLEDTTTAIGLRCLNDGTATFVRPGVESSVLDLSFATAAVRALWLAEPDSWGSDHLPIIITSPEKKPVTHKTCSVTNWDAFRVYFEDIISTGTTDHTTAISQALCKATRRVTVPIYRPNPDLKYLRLRASRRKAQRRALKTSRQEDIQRYRRIDAAFRRHTKRLQRKQWRQRCETLHSPGGGRQAWRMARILAGHAVPRSPVLGLVIAQNITLPQAAELLADEFTSAPAPPPGFVAATATSTPAQVASNSDFTLNELQHALQRSARKRTAPGPDGITFQALRNLDDTTLPGLLEYLNHIWRSSDIPPAWLRSEVVPIHKPGKPIGVTSSYRPISLTCCLGKVMERMVLRRLDWQLETSGALPKQLSGFRKQRCTTDAIGSLVSDMEQSKATRQATTAIFLDIKKACDAIPHETIIAELTRLGVAGRALAFVRAFLTGRSMHVRLGGIRSSQPALLYHPTARASINKIYTINGTDVARVRTYSYLGFLLDDRISWKPAVKATLIRCRRHLNAVRMMMGSRWGTSQVMMLQLYRGLILSRLLYALPLIHLSNAQSAAIETLQRIALRFCLGLPRYSPNIPTLVEARVNLVENHGRELTLRHIARQTSCRSTESLLNHIRSCPQSRLGSLARDFEGIVGTLDRIYPAPPPYASPLNISESIPELRSKRFTAQVVARTLAEYRIEVDFLGWMRVYTDGSVLHSRKSSTAAVFIPELKIAKSRKLSFHTTSTTAELAALWLGLDILDSIPHSGKAVFLTDSRIALQLLGSLEDAPQYARYIGHMTRNLESKGWHIAYQWLPSHVGISGNETADRLANAAHHIHVPTLVIPKMYEARLIIHKEIEKLHPDTRVSAGKPPARVPPKLSRASASLLHRLRTGCAFTAKALHRMDPTINPNCPSCDVPEDQDHLLWTCPTLADKRKSLLDGLRQAGVASATTQDILFPPGSARDVSRTFAAVLKFLEDTSLFDRL
ncbi:uncharacterized protein ISCGN_010436 [Ixodes scapularis]